MNLAGETIDSAETVALRTITLSKHEVLTQWAARPVQTRSDREGRIPMPVASIV